MIMFQITKMTDSPSHGANGDVDNQMEVNSTEEVIILTRKDDPFASPFLSFFPQNNNKCGVNMNVSFIYPSKQVITV